MKPLLSIRRVSRFGVPIFAVVWWLLWIEVFGGAQDPWFGLLGALMFVGGGNALIMLACRCPRCRRSTLTPSGRWLDVYVPPIWTPPVCPHCALDFRDNTFWSPANAALRAEWLASPEERPGPG